MAEVQQLTIGAFEKACEIVQKVTLNTDLIFRIITVSRPAPEYI